jgi:A/G-specific adenine glycosylase
MAGNAKMATNQKIDFFRKHLLKWFKEKGRHFSWRNKSATNYEKVISEILLQRTKAETVAKLYPKFIKKYPSWKCLARAKKEDLEIEFKEIGLYRQKAERVFLLAQEIKARQGRLPTQKEEIEAIPSFGQYITNAVLLLVHGNPTPLIDVNMARVLERFFGPRKLVDIRYDPYLQNLAHKVVQCDDPKTINWAILDFAALTCKIRNPPCNQCPLSNECKYFNT